VRVVVVGDIAWDIFIRPERDLVRGADVFGTVDVLPGGAAANVAVWTRRLGVQADLVGKIGDDTLGEVMGAHLRAEGVASHVRIVPGGLTTRVGILVSADGEHSFVIDHTKVLRFGGGDVDPGLIDGASALFFNGYDIYLAGSMGFLQPALAEARRRDVPIIFDPSSFALIKNYSPSRLLDELGPIDVLIANEDEARCLAPATGLHGLRHHAGLLVVKQGARGAAALGESGWDQAPAVSITAVDTTGAGDAFDAAFMVEWLGNGDVGSALRAGNALGAHVASRIGGQPAHPVSERPTRPVSVS